MSTPQAIPHAAPRFYTIQAADLQNLATILRGEERRPSTSKDLKLAKLPTFTGKSEDLEPFIRECELRFSIQPEIFDTPTQKAYFMLSFFKQGTAKLWKEQYISARVDKPLCQANEFSLFLEEL